jgi:hypothetical protein
MRSRPGGRTRGLLVPLGLAVVTGLLSADAARAHGSALPDDTVSAHDHEYPLKKSTLVLRDGAKRSLALRGRWRGAVDTTAVDPSKTGGTMRVSGSGGTTGDSGTIRLPAGHWTVKGRKYRYDDPAGAAGGVQTLVVKLTKRGGALKLKAGTDAWRYRLDAPQTDVNVTVEIGTSRWCAEFGGSDLKQRGASKVRATARVSPGACPCDALVAGTFDGVLTIFEQHGCTDALCHGATPGQGGLDLQRDVAWANLVDVPSEIDSATLRVLPGDYDHSLLFQKLAARTQGLQGVPGSGMPVAGEPLSADELRLVSLWIYNGAPATGIVPGSESLLLASCTPPPDPSKIPPPEPPAAGEGVQLHSAPWSIPIESESEVCFATYYDVSDQVPAESRGPCPASRGGPDRECLYYNRVELIQDPNSHHSIPRTYVGKEDVTNPSFGPFTCVGGTTPGESCNPKGIGVDAPDGAECGPGGQCAGKIVPAVACLGYGPPDFGQGFNLAESAGAPDIMIATEPRNVLQFPAGVMDAIPVAGTMVWNSHAFNRTPDPATNEQWLRFFFAKADEQQYFLQDFFHVKDIFIMNVPPFEQRQYCTTLTFKPGTRLFSLTSHTHKRGALFELWGPGGITDPCETYSDPTCAPEPGEPTLRTTEYSDPDVTTFDPPLALDGDDASRTVKYCALYDNGFTDPTAVKRQSTQQTNPNAQTCSDALVACLDGPHRGMLCGGDDAVCDSAPGSGDGVCDACPVYGWVTADDEMFALIGSYYCAEGTDCVLTSELPRTFPPAFPGL